MQRGQTAELQVQNLGGLTAALETELGESVACAYRIENGYALTDDAVRFGLLSSDLSELQTGKRGEEGEAVLERLRAALRVGVQQDAQVQQGSLQAC